MVVANFGMGIRPSSSVVKTEQERQIDYERQLEALQNRLSRSHTKLSGSVQARAEDFARQNIENTIAMGYNLTPQMQANLVKEIAPAYQGRNLASMAAPNPHTTNAPSPWSAQLREVGQLRRLEDRIATQPAQIMAQFGTQESAIASAQEAQQASYNGFQGGAVGGVLGNVARAGTGDPTQPGATMPWNQPWSTPGFGNPGSLGGLGGYNPGGGQNSQGWGSVFGGGRNPWSLA